ncbi:hypothetical protein PBRA_005177 [Plasmodiophora brassicae]|nr:hypothetical protein PBRA_005177 [Plasmodiophora brassicae]
MKRFSADELPPERWFHQKVDHFDTLDRSKFWQRFFINATFFDATSGPVFVYIGGESPISPLDVVLGHHVELAEQHNALVIAVEHRYYGKSWPTTDSSTGNLRLLSSQQALADLATFLEHIHDKFRLSRSNPVITFGGSYPGALSAWLRMKFPSQVFAAVASSAPIRARVGFFGYMEVVSDSFGDEAVGGSPHCQARIQQAFREVERVHQSDGGLDRLSRLFKACEPLTGDRDYVQLMQSLAGIFQGAVQYNNQVPLNVAKICRLFTGHGTSAIGHLAKLNDDLVRTFSSQCHSFSYDAMVQGLSNPTYSATSTDRQWIFQTCAELGYYQECRFKHRCLFSERIDLNASLRLCNDLFGMGEQQIFDSIEFTNTLYGGFHPGVSRILFVNGDIDPWHSLSILNEQHVQRQKAVYIRGASHCQDMKPSTPDDSSALREGRLKIGKLVGKWIAESRNEHHDSAQ